MRVDLSTWTKDYATVEMSVKHYFSTLAKPEGAYSGTALMAKRTPAVEALRKRVNARMKEDGHGGKVAFGKAIGMNPSSVTSFLAGNSNPTIDKIDAIARYLRCSVSDLFAPPSPTFVQDQTMRSGVESASPLSQGASHGAEISSLRQQLAELQAEYDEFAEEVGGAVKYFGSLVDKKAAKVTERQALARQNDRTYDRQFPGRERKRRGRS